MSSHESSARLTVVQPGEGRAGHLGAGLGVVFKIWGEETGGILSIVEHPFDVGVLVPPHVHSREDEISIVLEGEIGFRSGSREAVLGPGGYIVKPRGELHAMWNAGPTRARMIEIITPAGFECFFRDVVDALEGDATELDGAKLTADYGLTFADADWLPDVIAHYRLKAPPTA